ncbi:MFS transporter [Xenorhabdus anantnagensis]|uniref:MFS transporter n=1 Tax=Xenorhabdus anantnagensis TaxID=3025875 RepID=A0ABT5LWN6_9GAMM|nr:MFS transporter [Xenorhabdus anantnagensis]MDC9597410.1 MFS transporter [Xenorhabdus anantnagensis]
MALNIRERLFLLAMAIGSMGGGIWRPVAIFYLVLVQGLDIVDVGLSMTIGAMIALLIAGFPAGLLADKLGPAHSTLLGSLLRFIAFPWMLVVSTPWQVAIIVMFVSIGERIYWCANPAAIRTLFPVKTSQLNVFAIINSCRNIGLGCGALLSLFFINKDGISNVMANLIVWGNSLGYFISGIIIFIITKNTAKQSANVTLNPVQTDKDKTSSFSILTDKKYLIFVFLIGILLLAGKSIELVLPYYFLIERELPSWFAAFVFTGLCFGIPCFQNIALRLGNKFGCLKSLAWSSFLQTMAYGIIFFLNGDLLLQFILIFIVTLLLSLSEAILGSQMGVAILMFSLSGYEGRYSAVLQFAFGGSTVIAPWLFTQLLSFSSTTLWGSIILYVTLTGIGFIILNRYHDNRNNMF